MYHKGQAAVGGTGGDGGGGGATPNPRSLKLLVVASRFL